MRLDCVRNLAQGLLAGDPPSLWGSHYSLSLPGKQTTSPDHPQLRRELLLYHGNPREEQGYPVPPAPKNDHPIHSCLV